MGGVILIQIVSQKIKASDNSDEKINAKIIYRVYSDQKIIIDIALYYAKITQMNTPYLNSINIITICFLMEMV